MNTEGIRTGKTSSGVEHRYTLNGTQIVTEQFGSHYLVYLYDESGRPKTDYPNAYRMGEAFGFSVYIGKMG